MVRLAVSVIVALLLCALVYWVAILLPLPRPIPEIAVAIMAIVCLLYLLRSSGEPV
jgi:hypothetical protein